MIIGGSLHDPTTLNQGQYPAVFVHVNRALAYDLTTHKWTHIKTNNGTQVMGATVVPWEWLVSK